VRAEESLPKKKKKKEKRLPCLRRAKGRKERINKIRKKNN
jgi:hypothetical protein